MTVSPYLQLKTRTEAQARQERINRIAREKFDTMPTVCRKALEGDPNERRWVYDSFIFSWRWAS